MTFFIPSIQFFFGLTRGYMSCFHFFNWERCSLWVWMCVELYHISGWADGQEGVQAAPRVRVTVTD